MAVGAGLWPGAEHTHAFDFIVSKSQAAGGALPGVGTALGGFVNGAAGFLAALGIPVKVGATVVAVLVISFAAAGSVLILIYADFDSGAKSLWPVFGATNQVLAAFTLMLCALYLRTIGRKAIYFAAPAVFVMTITFSAMGIQVSRDLAAGKWLVGGVGTIIAILTLWVAFEGAMAWRRTAPPPSHGAIESAPG